VGHRAGETVGVGVEVEPDGIWVRLSVAVMETTLPA
jgi:hypothetical protein